jgi:hypothetical protein
MLNGQLTSLEGLAMSPNAGIDMIAMEGEENLRMVCDCGWSCVIELRLFYEGGVVNRREMKVSSSRD